jgi:two-component system nitrogen regulation response regulator GlnG
MGLSDSIDRCLASRFRQLANCYTYLAGGLAKWRGIVSGWDTNDLTLPEISLPRSPGTGRALALTLLYHPDSERIGEIAVICSRAGSGYLGRLQPLFTPPRGKPRGRALADRYLSRTPIEFELGERCLRLRIPPSGVSLKVDDRTVRGEILLDPGLLQRGIVLSLAHRVVLLLHWHSEVESVADECGLVGEHEAVQAVRRLVQRVAERETHVLLLGESGTGKELVASAIHRRGRRRKAMITVNVAAIPQELAAAELFGVRRGAFTGADGDRSGYFREADGGTLFLDEVGACSAEVQAQLLRALQQGEVQVPGGGTVKVDVRVLAATDADPGASFSTALRHRLGGFEILLPPLRERRMDIGRLLVHFLPGELLGAAEGNPGEVSRWVGLVSRMALYGWPGNVRELANFCRQLEIASGDGLGIPENINRQLADVGASVAPTYESEMPTDERVKDAMLAARWEVSRAARELQISRQALYRRIASIPELRTAADIPGAEIESAFHECGGDLDQAALRLQVSRAALQRRWRAMDLLPGRRW